MLGFLARSSRRGRWAVVALIALGLVYAWTIQGPGNNQISHYVLIKAIASGTPAVDGALTEIGEQSTRDLVVYEGRTYSNKSPGLTFLSLPLFMLLRGLGVDDVGDPTDMLWALGLWGSVLPAVALAFLVRGVAERIEPGFGTAAAVATGLGTLILPFAVVFYSHVLAACLAFAAFALLFHERHGRPRLWLVLAAGAAAGYGVATDYPNAIPASVLFLYALAHGPRFRRAGAYVAGALVGVAPLLLYNTWAFDSFARISYSLPSPPAVERWVDRGGQAEELPLLDAGADPSFLVFLSNMFGKPGLVTFAPVLLCAVAGLILLVRRWRLEAATVSAVALGMLVYDSSFGFSFGGFAPGPRYLMAILPFLGIALAPAFRRLPSTTTALTLASALIMTSMTATYITGAYDGRWFHRLADGDFVLTAASFVGVTGWAAIAFFFAAAATAALAALLASRAPESRPVETLAAAVALLGWSVLAARAPVGERAEQYGGYGWTAVGLVLIVAAMGAANIRGLPRRLLFGARRAGSPAQRDPAAT